MEDFLEPEVGIAAAVAAAVFSPRVRGVLRRGAVYGVAGALMAGDAVSAFARGVGRGVQPAGASTSADIRDTSDHKETETAAKDQPKRRRSR
jgi:hypothetical protein